MNRLYRWFATHCVCWSADGELPTWLRSKLKGSEEFLDCEREFDAFEARLRSDASAWAAAESSPAPAGVHPSNRELTSKKLPRSWQAVISVGLVTAASVGLFVAMRSQEPSSPTKQESASQTPIADVQQATNEFQALTSVFADSLNNIDDSLSGLSSATQISFDVSDSRLLRDAIKKPLESFSRGYGKAIAFVAKHQVPE